MRINYVLHICQEMNHPKQEKVKICFIHPPKCGGTSIDSAIRASLDIGHHSLAATRINPARTKAIADFLGREYLELREFQLSLILRQPWLRYAVGHAKCSPKTRRVHESTWRFVTILREPARRWISEYFYNRYKTTKHFKLEISLDEYLESELGQRNGALYSHMFSSKSQIEPEERSIDAIKNLQQFSIVGELENPNHFVRQFEALTGLRLSIPHINRNPQGADFINSSVTKKQMERIQNICFQDYRIYEHFKIQRHIKS